MSHYLHHLLNDPLGLVDQAARDLLITLTITLVIFLLLGIRMLFRIREQIKYEKARDKKYFKNLRF